MAIHMKVTGTKQGVFTGDVAVAPFVGQILVHSVHFGVMRPTDAATFLPTGKAILRPVTITKSMDKSSPLFFNAAYNNESAKVLLTYTYEGGTSTVKKQVATIELTNVTFMEVSHSADADGNAVETVAYGYTKIEYTWVDGGIVASADVQVNV